MGLDSSTRHPSRRGVLHSAAIPLFVLSGIAAAQTPATRPKLRNGFAEAQRNTGVVPGLNLRAKPKVLWKYAPAGSWFSRVVTFDGVVIALDRATGIHALDVATGKVLWKIERKKSLNYGFGLALTRSVDFDALLVSCDTGLFAVERKTGKVLWETKIPKGVAGPTCTKASVFAGGADGKLYACDVRTGRLRWTHDYLADRPEDPEGFDGAQARLGEERPARPTSAATDGTTVFLSVFDQCRTIAVDAATGKRRWSFQSKGWMSARPTVGDRDVYVGSQDQHFYALDKNHGTVSWKIKTGSRNEAAAAATKKLVLFGSCDGMVYAADRALGSIVWRFQTREGGAAIYSRPIVSRDTVYGATLNGTLYAIELRSGKRLWKFEPLADSFINSDLESDASRLFLTTRGRGNKGESAVLAIGH